MSVFSFSDKELSPEQVEKLNAILPERFRKSTWKKSDFEGSESLYERFSKALKASSQVVGKLEAKLKNIRIYLDNIEVENITIFNTEPYNAEPLGLVDIGLVAKFGTLSSGDRFAAGVIGYAIEKIADEAFAKSNLQIAFVEKTKLELVKKARKYYPECNLLFKYEVDFREIGSSGNVFIYMRGTAAKGENKKIQEAKSKTTEQIFNLEKEIEEKKAEIKRFQDIRSKIPKDKWNIEKLL